MESPGEAFSFLDRCHTYRKEDELQGQAGDMRPSWFRLEQEEVGSGARSRTWKIRVV